MMNEGGYVQGYNHGGLHDPVTDKAIPQSVPSSVYPINQFITPGASTISSALNPYVAPSEPPFKVGPMPVDSDSTVRYVTYEKPGSGEIRVIAFRGDTPVNPDEVTSALQAGYFPQGSDELAQVKADMNRDPEKDYDVTTGSKPFNKMTVGELAYTISRHSYNGAFPDSLSAGASKLFGMTGISKIGGSVLGNISSEVKIAIGTAAKRLERNQYSNAAEKAALEIMAGLDPTKPKTNYKAMYDLTGYHSGASGKGYKRNIRIKDFSKDVMVDDLKATSLLGNRYTSSSEALKDAGADTMRVAGDIREQEKTKREDALESIKKAQDDAAANNRTIAQQGRIDAPSGPSPREEAEDAARSSTTKAPEINNEDQRSKDPEGRGNRSTSGSAYSGRTGSNREFGMNKGGLLKKPKKKTKTKK